MTGLFRQEPGTERIDNLACAKTSSSLVFSEHQMQSRSEDVGADVTSRNQAGHEKTVGAIKELVFYPVDIAE